MNIKTIDQLNDQEYSQLVEVYKLTATHPDAEIKYKYFDFYKENASEFFLVAVDSDKVVGYVCGMLNTLNSYEQFEMHQYLDHFREEIELYPAHLHINVHPDHQGKGVGKHLLTSFENKLTANEMDRVHIFTLDQEDNKAFYQKVGFDFSSVKKFNDKDLLFMGKSLN